MGTAEGLRAIQSDEQLANCFTPFSLPLWHADAAYTRLLNTLELLLPLRRPSGLAEPALAHKILSASEGVLGEIVSLLVQTAVAAIRQGHEAIRVELLENMSFIPPHPASPCPSLSLWRSSCGSLARPIPAQHCVHVRMKPWCPWLHRYAGREVAVLRGLPAVLGESGCPLRA